MCRGVERGVEGPGLPGFPPLYYNVLYVKVTLCVLCDITI